MDLKLPNEDLLQIIIHDYLKKRGLSTTAEIFQIETQLSGPIPNAMDQPPHGYLYNFWSSSYNPKIAMNDDATINSIPRILREGYQITHVEGFESGQSLLSCDISSDGNIVASGGNGMKPFICYVENHLSATSVELHSGPILDVRFQPGTNIFATASADKTVKLWDANRPKIALSDFVGHNWRVRSVDLHPLGQVLCSSEAVGLINLWDINQQRLMDSHAIGGSKVRFQPGSGRLLAVANINVIAIHDSRHLAAPVIMHLKGHVHEIYSICWDATGRFIASISQDGVRVWSVVRNGQCMYHYSLNEGRFRSVIFHPRYKDVLVIGGTESLELLVLEKAKISVSRSPRLSVTALAGTTAQREHIVTVSQQSNSVVNIWK